MFKENEIKIEDEIIDVEKPVESFVLENKEVKEPSIEEKVDNALERQEHGITQREEKYDKKVLSGLKKWVGVATVMGASLLAVGCGAEKSSSDGFTDNVHQNVQQRLEQTRDRVRHMKEMKGYQPSEEARDVGREMNEEPIVQPIDQSEKIK